MSKVKRKPVLIRDGRNRTAKFPESGGCGEFSFTFRPNLPEETLEFTKRKLDNTTPEVHMKGLIKLILSKGVGWDVVEYDENDNEIPQPLSEQSLRRMPVHALEWMSDTICSYRPADEAADAKNFVTASA